MNYLSHGSKRAIRGLTLRMLSYNSHVKELWIWVVIKWSFSARNKYAVNYLGSVIPVCENTRM